MISAGITPRGEIEENRGEYNGYFAKIIKTIKVTALHIIIERAECLNKDFYARFTRFKFDARP